MRQLRRNSVQVGPWLVGGVMMACPTGCDSPGWDSFEEVDVSEIDGEPPKDPSPGGSHCKACVTDFKFEDGRLYLCVDTSVRRIHSWSAVVGLTASEPWFLSPWSIWTGSVATTNIRKICTNCQSKIELPPQGDSPFAVVSMPVDPQLPTWSIQSFNMVLEDSNDYPKNTELYPTIRVAKKNGSNFSCPELLTNVFEAADGKSPALPNAEGLISSSDPVESMVQIVYDWPFGGIRSCSGALISPRHVLTAAHCFDPAITAADLKLGVGVDSLNHTPDEFLAAVAVNIHPSWGMDQKEFDLAIVELAHPLEDRQPLPLTTVVKANCETAIEVLGYGVGGTSNEGYDWGTLYKRKMVQKSALCVDPDKVDCVDTQVYIPFVGTTAAHQLCHGDSGAPLFSTCGGKRRLHGIATARVLAVPLDGAYHETSGAPMEHIGAAFAFDRGNACGEDGAIGYVATRIDGPTVLPWIMSTIEPPPLYIGQIVQYPLEPLDDPHPVPAPVPESSPY